LQLVVILYTENTRKNDIIQFTPKSGVNRIVLWGLLTGNQLGLKNFQKWEFIHN